MIRDRLLKLLAAGLFGLLACLPFGVRAAEQGPNVAIVSFGLFGDQSVFASESKGAAAIIGKRFGGGKTVVRFNTRTRNDATVETLAATLLATAKDMDPQNDLLVLVLTSHGSHEGIAIQYGGRVRDVLSPPRLMGMLEATGVRRRVVIISACYSGIFIPVIANPDTLVITAADAEHPSFGCQDGATWTYFGDALFNTALRRAANIKDAFALAQTLVRRRELRNGFDPSNPQMAGGENLAQLLEWAPVRAPDAPGRGPSRNNHPALAPFERMIAAGGL